jgi:hypothetical protein
MQVDTTVRLGAGDHVVQFYERDEDLVEMVVGYLAAAVRDGDAVAVIATPEHRSAFEQRLADADVSLEDALEAGSVILLDAAETLATFMADGRPDPEAFDAVVGGLVRSLGGGERPVRAYGEMVALLWAEGNEAGAIELEAMWNELGERLPFSLFCAYPSAHVSDAAHAIDFAGVCRLHSHVVAGASVAPDAEVSMRFWSNSLGPRLARRFVAETLTAWSLPTAVDDACLVVSELATNAIRHTAGDFTVAMWRVGDDIRIAVGDVSPSLPVPGEVDAQSPCGRGLKLVRSVARQWGHYRSGTGKIVWALIAA